MTWCDATQYWDREKYKCIFKSLLEGAGHSILWQEDTPYLCGNLQILEGTEESGNKGKRQKK